MNTPSKPDIDRAFHTVYSLNSMVQILNHKTSSRAFEPIRVGIGASWGRGLMIDAGLAGSAINDVIYMGDVVNQAAKPALYGSINIWQAPINVSDDCYITSTTTTARFCSATGGTAATQGTWCTPTCRSR